MNVKFGQLTPVQTSTVQQSIIANKPLATETEQTFKSNANITNVDGFVSSNAKTVANIGNMPNAAAAGLNKFVGLSSDDIAKAGPGPSFTSKLISNIKKAPEFPTAFPQGDEAAQAA